MRIRDVGLIRPGGRCAGAVGICVYAGPGRGGADAVIVLKTER
jgi:hypothetical protein